MAGSKNKQNLSNARPILHNVTEIQNETRMYCQELSRHLSRTLPLIQDPVRNIESIADENGRYTYPIWMGNHMVKNSVQVVQISKEKK